MPAVRDININLHDGRVVTISQSDLSHKQVDYFGDEPKDDELRVVFGQAAALIEQACELWPEGA